MLKLFKIKLLMNLADKNKLIVYLLLALVLYFTSPFLSLCAERNYIRRVYRVSDGLKENQVTSVTVSPRGNIWARHGELNVLSYLDGYTVKHIPAPSGNYRIYESKSGQIWSLYSGGLQELKGDRWVAYPIDDIRDEVASDPLRRIRQIPLLPTKRDRVCFLTSKALFEFDSSYNVANKIIGIEETRLERFIDMIPASDGGAWITGTKGILRVLPETFQSTNKPVWREYLFDPSLNVENGLRPVEDDSGGLTLVADSLEAHKRVSLYFDGKKWQKAVSLEESIRQSWRDIGETFWGLTMNRLVRFRYFDEHYVEKDDFNPGQLFEIAIAKGGVFWVATIDGLYRFAPALWSRSNAFENIATVVHSMNQTPDGHLLVITSDGLGILEKNNKLSTYSFEEGTEQYFQPNGAPYIMPSGMLALNIGNRAHFFNIRRKEFILLEHPSGRNCKLIGQLNNGNICLITTDPRQPQGGYRLDLFDGKRFRHFMEATNTALLGQEVFFVKQVSSGDVWVSGEKSLAVNKNGEWMFLNQISYQAPTGAISFIEIATNKFWFGTQDNLHEYDGKNWRIIKSNLGRVRSIFKSRNGAVWVATASGLYRYEQGKWVSNGTQDGLPSQSIYSVFEDSSGTLWACTARGLAYFVPDADQDPPVVKINSPKDNAIVSTEDAVTVSFSGTDKWKYTLTDRLLYSWRLTGTEWSEYSEESNITLKGLNSGTYQLFVKAMDRNMNESTTPAMIEFTVIVPWYKDDRTMAIALVGAAVAIVLAGIAVNKHFQLKRSYAEVERKVNERTKQLEVATQQLLLSQKMTALGTLAAGIAHDFNNILSIIKGSAQIIEDNIDNKEKVLLRVQRIKTAVDQGSSIVKAMLGFSKQNGANVSVIDVNQVVDETIKLLGERFLREVPLHFIPAYPLPKVLGIRDLLQQMLLNLILNATDAIQETKGYIEITTGIYKTLPSPLILNPEPAEEFIFITVRDTGCGMTPEVMSRIFEPFFTTKNFSSKRGTGLGLTTVYQFARQLNYGIFVKSQVGEGSNFTIIIPVKEIESAAETSKTEGQTGK